MSLRDTLSHRPFRRLWFGQLASRIGDSVHEIALIWVVYEVTGDPTLLSATFVASFLPTVVLSLPAGAVIDRVNRKYVLVGSDLFRAAAVLAIPLFGRGPLLVPTVLVVAFVTGVADAVDGPARGAFVPRLVPDEDLDGANSLVGMTRSLSQVLFAAGGVAVAVFGSFAAFYVDAGSFVVSALFVASIPSEYGVPDRHDAEAVDAEAETGRTGLAARTRTVLADVVGDVRSVLGFVRERPLLRNLLALGVVLQFAIAPLNVAIPMYAPTLPMAGSLAVGVLYSGFFGGMTLGMVVIGQRDAQIDDYRGLVIVGSLVAFGVLLAAAPLVPVRTLLGVAAVTLLFALAGLAFAGASVPDSTLAQLLVPDDRRGRYTSVASVLTKGAFVIGLAIAGPLIELVGAAETLVAVGGGVVLIGVGFAFQPLVRAHEHVSTADGAASSTADVGAPED